MNIHPICLAIPEMQPEEFASLIESIKENGYDAGEPVVRFEGMILDGRHRWRACEQLRFPLPPVQDFKGDTSAAVRFVERRNLRRRNLTASQRAMAAAALLPFHEQVATSRQAGSRAMPGQRIGKAPERIPGPMRGEAREHAARAAGTNPRYVSDAKRIATEAPEVAERVRKGEITIPEAKRISKAPPPPGAAPAARVDEAGRPVTVPEVAAILDRVPELHELVNAVHALRRKVADLRDDPLGAELRIQQIEADLKNAVNAIRFAFPFTTCPNFPNCENGCHICSGRRWVTKEVWNRIPAEQRA